MPDGKLSTAQADLISFPALGEPPIGLAYILIGDSVRAFGIIRCPDPLNTRFGRATNQRRAATSLFLRTFGLSPFPVHIELQSISS